MSKIRPDYPIIAAKYVPILFGFMAFGLTYMSLPDFGHKQPKRK